MVRWTRRNNTIYLRQVDYSSRAEGKGAIARAVESASLEPIVMAFNVEAEGKDKSAVIDVTRLFTSDPTELSVKGRLGGGGVDPTRSYIEKTKSFPDQCGSEIASHLRRAAWQRFRPGTLQHGAAARKAHDASSVRLPRRLFHRKLSKITDAPKTAW